MNYRARLGFEGYQIYPDLNAFKVFVLEDDWAWEYRNRDTYEAALKAAMDACDKHASRRGLCRLFAVGDTVVWDMSEKERDAVIEAYRTRNDN